MGRWKIRFEGNSGGIIKRNLFETSEVIFAWSNFFSFFFWNWNWRETILSFLYTFFLSFESRIGINYLKQWAKIYGQYFSSDKFFLTMKKGISKIERTGDSFPFTAKHDKVWKVSIITWLTGITLPGHELWITKEKRNEIPPSSWYVYVTFVMTFVSAFIRETLYNRWSRKTRNNRFRMCKVILTSRRKFL